MPSAQRQFTLPDLKAMCPIRGSFSPCFREAAAASSAWADTFAHIVADRKRTAFRRAGSELLCGHVFSYAGAEQLRTTMDFVNLLFAIDEISDDQSGRDARATGRVVLCALRDAAWDDGSGLCKMAKEFRTRMVALSGPGCFRRFLTLCEAYLVAVGVEAELRERGEVLDVHSYTLLRRSDSAVRLCFGLFEMCLGADLPEAVFFDATYTRMLDDCVDMVCLANDVYSYNMEQAIGHTGNNYLTVLMQEKGCDLQTAADLVGERFAFLMDRFMADKARLRSWGPAVDAEVAKNVMAMGNWVVGNLNWSFETARYFGREREEVARTLVVKLKPTRACDE